MQEDGSKKLNLTLYVVREPDATREDLERLVQSFGEGVEQVTLIGGDQFKDIKEDRNDWFAIMYPKEYLDANCQKSLPIYLQSEYDYIIMMKLKRKVEDGITSPDVTQAPRIFRKNVTFAENSLLPDNWKSLKSVRMLDGWILEVR